MNIPQFDKNTIIGNLRQDIRQLLASDSHYAIVDSNLYQLYPALFEGTCPYIVTSGEQSKTINTVHDIILDMLERNCNRDTTVLSIGGGTVSDIAGFVASIYMRGVDWICVPTTLLAQVDASSGGKTGVNVFNYKNMIGSFWLPKVVLCDITLLASLPQREWLSGIGEIVKTSLLNAELWEYLNANLNQLVDRQADVISDIVNACISIKSSIVALDLHDVGARRNLNLGHTMGHALETCGEFELSHGEYVLLGITLESMLFAEYINPEYLDNIRLLLSKVAPTMPKLDLDKIVAIASKDKKNKSDKIVFVVPVDIGQVQHLEMSQLQLKQNLKEIIKNNLL
ncbi:MAG: 3-dehydroquinate synthase [Clostridiales bacterium]|jgi:3-dehydroquinate synthase|nr:3-dehydroquinate synthase [Clostridiales bacterium]